MFLLHQKVLMEKCTVLSNLKTIMEEGKFERKEGKVPTCSICYLSFDVRPFASYECSVNLLFVRYFSGALVFFTFTINILLSTIPDEYRVEYSESRFFFFNSKNV